MDLIADIGATSTRCGLLDINGKLVRQATYINASYDDPQVILLHFLSSGRASDKATRAALAVAAPILQDEVTMLNLDWRFSQNELRSNLGLSRLSVVNDFAAVAWSLPSLATDDLRQVGSGSPAVRSPAGTVGPGSGLGVGGIVPAGTEGWAVVSGEGGHVSVAPATALETDIVDAVRAQFGHCSAERLLSGPGLLTIYRELARIRSCDATVADPATVSELAEKGDPLAQDTLDIFFSLLGGVAGDLARTLGARGGIFIAGGIIPRMPEALDRSPFRERFLSKGRYRDYLDGIPTYLITAPVPAFVGLRRILGHS